MKPVDVLLNRVDFIYRTVNTFAFDNVEVDRCESSDNQGGHQ